MNRLLMLEEVRLLLVRSFTRVAVVGTKIKMNVVPVTPETICEVEDLVAIRARVTPLIQMCSDIMFRLVALFSEALSALFTFELLNLEVDDAVMLPRRARVTKGAAAFLALNVLALSSLSLNRLGNFLVGDAGSVVFARACGLGRRS